MFGKRFLALVMTLCMVSAVFVPLPLSASAEVVVETDSANESVVPDTQEADDGESAKPAHPNAEVSVLKPIVLTPEVDEYWVFDGSLEEAESDLPLQVVMNFKANDTIEEAQASKYGKWICDFYLTFSGAEGTFKTEGSYLAGNYGSFGWIAIPADYFAEELKYNEAYPVVGAYDPNLTYENICDYVKDFTAAIYVADALLANPDFKVTLELRMTNPENPDDYMVIGEPAVYTVKDLLAGNDITDIKGNSQIGGTVDTEANSAAIESAKQELAKEFPELEAEQIANATVVINVEVKSVETVVGDAPASYTYNVSPMFGVDDSRVKISTFDTPVTFRLPVHSAETKVKANVYHNDELVGIYDIETENGEKFVKVSSINFSEFKVEPIEVPVEVVVKNAEEAQAALDNVTPNMTIELVEGVNYGVLYMRPSENNPATKVVDWVGNNYHYETYTLFDGLTIIGAKGATIDAIEIEGGTYYYSEHSQSDLYPVMLSLIELKDVKFEGITFTGNGGYDPQGYGNAINISGSNIKVDGLTIENCVLDDSDDSARLLYKTEATTHVHTYAYGGVEYTLSPSQKDIKIIGCTFNGGYMGLELREIENLEISGNVFNGVSSRDILIASNDGCECTGDVIIKNNTSNGAGNRFLRASGIGAANLVITGNAIVNYAGTDGDFIKVEGITSTTAVSGNTFDGEEVDFSLSSGTIKLNKPVAKVAKIGETKYESLAAAVEAAKVNDTITLLDDITLAETLEIPADKTITLDLNGKTISQEKAQTGNYQMILNDGNLTVEDGIGGGKISYTDTVGGNFISNTITNRGTLTLKSGIIENLSSADVANAGFPYAIDTSIWGAATAVNTIIEGGTVTCENYSALRLRADSETKAVNVTIVGGIVNGRIEVQNPTSNKATSGKLTVSDDAVINQYNSSKAIMIFGGGGTGENLDVEITGGEINGVIGYSNNFPISKFDEQIISGGTFSEDVSDFCVDGVEITKNADGTYGVKAGTYVAQIGDVKYESLDAAIEAAQANDVITLIADVEIASTIKITADKKITLDLAGHVIDAVGNTRIAIMSYGELTIKDTSAEKTGTVKAGKPYDNGKPGGNTINVCAGTFTLESGNIYSQNNGILIDEQAATVIIKGGKITAEPETVNSAAIYISSTTATVLEIIDGEMIGQNGILLWNNTTIKISGGSITATELSGIQGNGSEDVTDITITGGTINGGEVGIYHPQGGKLTISGGSISGDTGIVVKGGKVAISGGAISADGEAGAYKPEGSGYVGTGDALYIEHYDNSTSSENYGTPVVTVTGGTFVSANGKAVASYANPDNDVDALAGFTSGGTFNTSIAEEFCAEGYIPAVVDGKYTVKEGSYVAQIGETKYETLEEAIEATGENDVIKLISDITLANMITIPADKTITLDLNGKTISTVWENESAGKHYYAFTNKGALTINDSATGGAINSRGIFNYGKLILESGTINSIDGNGGYAVRNYAGASFVMNGGKVATTLEDDNLVDEGGYDATAVRVDEGASFEMNGGEIVNVCDFTFAIDNYGTTTIKGGKVSSVHTTIANYGTMTIDGGEFTCNGIEGVTAHVVWVSEGTVTINGGTFDGKDNYNGFNVDSSEGAKAIITGGEFLSVHSGSLYGKGEIEVSGGKFFDKVPEDRCAEGYIPTVVDGKYTVKVGTYVAQIGDVKYESLDAAIEAAQAGEEIELISTLVIEAGETVTLDLKGHTIFMNQSATVSKNHEMILNKGNLTIKDSVGGGKLSYKYTGGNLGTTYAANTVTTEPGSVLTVESGIIENNTYDSATIAYAIDARTNGGAGDVVVNIKGGTITSKRQAIRVFANSTTKTGTLNISGGEITGRVIVQNANTSANKAKLEITGGTFVANDYKTEVLYVGGSDGATIDMEATVSGGTFSGEILSSIPSGFISGGTFDKPVSDEFCAEGFVPAVVDGKYTVKIDSCVAQIGDVKYESFEAALAAAGEGDVVKLLSDVKAMIVYLEKGSLDLNGHKISANLVVAIKGTSIIDSSEGNVGRLQLEKDHLVMTNEAYPMLPVYINDSEGYMFISVTNNSKTHSVTENSFVYEFRPSVGSVVYELLKDGAADNELEISVHIEAMKEDKSMGVLEKDCSDDLVKTVYSGGKAFKLTVNGISAFSSVKITVVVKSGTGVIFESGATTISPAAPAVGE